MGLAAGPAAFAVLEIETEIEHRSSLTSLVYSSSQPFVAGYRQVLSIERLAPGRNGAVTMRLAAKRSGAQLLQYLAAEPFLPGRSKFE
ncbi:MAG: hypothetical protein RQ741_08815 [Wenzhouxiangellaceae bacterium]|nr:hypothetical protein [Wenzhouxiangellaceae bacterium]